MRIIRKIPIVWVRHHGPIETHGVVFQPKGPAKVLIGFCYIDETPKEW